MPWGKGGRPVLSSPSASIFYARTTELVRWAAPKTAFEEIVRTGALATTDRYWRNSSGRELDNVHRLNKSLSVDALNLGGQVRNQPYPVRRIATFEDPNAQVWHRAFEVPFDAERFITRMALLSYLDRNNLCRVLVAGLGCPVNPRAGLAIGRIESKRDTKPQRCCKSSHPGGALVLVPLMRLCAHLRPFVAPVGVANGVGGWSLQSQNISLASRCSIGLHLSWLPHRRRVPDPVSLSLVSFKGFGHPFALFLSLRFHGRPYYQAWWPWSAPNARVLARDQRDDRHKLHLKWDVGITEVRGASVQASNRTRAAFVSAPLARNGSLTELPGAKASGSTIGTGSVVIGDLDTACA